MIRQPPIGDWPARDRELWNRAVEPGGLFGGAGAGAHWSAASRVMVACGYNAWLSWLAAKELLDPDIRPTDRVTCERVAAYTAEIQPNSRPIRSSPESKGSMTRCASWSRNRIGSGWRNSAGA
jgi:hypothetical protein